MEFGGSGPLTPQQAKFGNWPTYDQNPQRTGANLLERTLDRSNVSHLTKSWTFVTHGPVEGSVAVVNGTAYLGDWAGYVYAVYASNGTQKWNNTAHNISADATTGIGGTWVIQWCSTGNGAYPVEGVTGTPTVYGNSVYVVDQDSLASLHIAGGKVNWSVNLSTDSTGSPLAHYIWSSPLVFNGSVYVGMASGCDTPEVQGVLFKIPINSTSHNPAAQFNVTSGTIIPNGCNSTGGTIWSTPAVDPTNNTIWITTGNPNYCQTLSQEPRSQSVIALDASTLARKGSWQVPTKCALNDCDFGAGPTMVDTGGHPLVVATSKSGFAYALNRSNVSVTGWSPVWSTQTGRHSEIAPAAFDGSTVFLGGGNSSWNNTSYSYTGLPSGCTPGNVSTFSCNLAGVTGGNYTVTATIRDIFGSKVTANTTLWVNPPTTFPRITSFYFTGGSASVNHVSSIRTTATGGTTPYTYSYSNLPPRCSSSNSSAISCNPSAAGLYHLKVTVTDTSGHTVSAWMTMAVLQTYSKLIPTYWNSAVGPNFDSFNVSPAEAYNSAGSTAVFSVADYTGSSPYIPDYPGGIWAVNPTNHAVRWFHPTHGYVRAGLTYANGMVIDTSEWQNASGSTVELLNSSTGTPIALENFTGNVQINGEPTVSDGRIFLGGAPSNFGGAGSLTAFGLPLLNVPSFVSATPVQGGVLLTLLGHVAGGVQPDTCSWTFGSGTAVSGCGLASHVYTANGSYSGTMYANDSAAETSSYKFTVVVVITVTCPPVGPCIGAILVVNLTSTCGIQGGVVICPHHTWVFAASVTGGVAPYTYLWNFGDQMSSTLAQPAHTYAQSGTYTVTLTVTDAVHLQTHVSFELRDT